MTFKHVHLKTCNSTQDYLRENFQDSPILISTDEQINGHGTRGRKWSSFENALCFSFSITPSPTLSLTAIEMAILTRRFFDQFYKIDLKLKWPNDLLNHAGEKVGGILLQSLSSSTFAAGIGLNLFPGNEFISEEHFKTKPGYIAQENLFGKMFKQDCPFELFKFILKNRLSSEQITSEWKIHCAHLGQKVSIEDNSKIHTGTFIDIGPQGEAILLTESGREHFYSGSLNRQ